MIGALNGRASIYLTKYLQDNLTDLNKYMSAKGFTSFNSYNNSLITDDFNSNFAKLIRNHLKLCI